MEINGDKQQNNEMEKIEYVTRLIHPKECEEAHRLVDSEDWNLTFAKFKKLVHVFTSSIFVTVKKITQEVVVVASVIPTFPDQYVIGNLVVRSDHRSKGLGKSMLLYILKNIQHSGAYTVTLTAVPGTFQFYSKLGFQEVHPPHQVNYVIAERAAIKEACSEHNNEGEEVVISKYKPEMFQALNDYDTQARGYDCGKYLSVMTAVSDTFLLATGKDSGQVLGYASGVDEPSLLLVDGLYADSDVVALLLYRTLLDMHPDKQEMKIQEIKPRDFLSQFGKKLPKSHTYTRMATGPTPPVSLSKLYVVCDCDYSE